MKAILKKIFCFSFVSIAIMQENAMALANGVQNGSQFEHMLDLCESWDYTYEIYEVYAGDGEPLQIYRLTGSSDEVPR